MNTIDIEQWIDLFDTALMSDDPRVKSQLSRLLMIATLVSQPTTQSNVPILGPIGQLYNEVSRLNREVEALKNDIRHISYFKEKNEYLTAQQAYQSVAEIKKFIPPQFSDYIKNK